MQWCIIKNLLTANDSLGRRIDLVRFNDGRWGFLIDGQRQAVSWPRNELPAAARAYRDLVLSPPERSESTGARA